MLRRSFLAGLFAAPAIVKCSALMPISVWREPGPRQWFVRGSLGGILEVTHSDSAVLPPLGTSWGNPFATLEEALKVAGSRDKLFVSDTHIEGPVTIPCDAKLERCTLGFPKVGVGLRFKATGTPVTLRTRWSEWT